MLKNKEEQTTLQQILSVKMKYEKYGIYDFDLKDFILYPTNNEVSKEFLKEYGKRLIKNISIDTIDSFYYIRINI